MRIYPYVRSVQSALHSKTPGTENNPITRSIDSFPLRLQDIPILGVRIDSEGRRLVYRVKPPQDEVCVQTFLQKLC